MKNIGDLITIQGTGDFAQGIECIIVEMDDGIIMKAKAANPDERLARAGFFKEGDDYVIFSWLWWSN